MTRLLAQHGPAKGNKITDSLNSGALEGVIFSPNDESVESIVKYITATSQLKFENVYLDPQFYYSTFEREILKKLSDLEVYPSNIARRDWRNRTSKITDYLDYHIKSSSEISSTLITPGFYIDNIDWRFDYSIELYNHCKNNYSEEYTFNNYALSLLIQTSFFNNLDNVNEMIDELNETCESKDYIYLTLCHETNSESNYEEMDANSLANILHMIYQLQQSGFKFIIGYTFVNSLLFSMVGCDFIASGWFNTLRKFRKDRLEIVDSFGRRKKRYTSLPLLSNIMFEDLRVMLDTDTIIENDILSDTLFDLLYNIDEAEVSFVDLEHQYWQSINSGISQFADIQDIVQRTELMNTMIEDALRIYQAVIQELDHRNENEAVRRIRTASKHLGTWLVAIDKFKNLSLIL